MTLLFRYESFTVFTVDASAQDEKKTDVGSILLFNALKLSLSDLRILFFNFMSLIFLSGLWLMFFFFFSVANLIWLGPSH